MKERNLISRAFAVAGVAAAMVALPVFAESSNQFTAGQGTPSYETYNSGADMPTQNNFPYYESTNQRRPGGMGNQTLWTSTKPYRNMLQGGSGRLSATTGLIAPGSVSAAPIGSSPYKLGFPDLAPQLYRGAYSTNGPAGAVLPPVSTSAVDITSMDDSGTRSGGSIGGPFGSPGGDGHGAPGDGGMGPPPDLPPGWQAVECHGVWAGAIPPGGSVRAFWRGEYGFWGSPEQQDALRREGEWLLENGQLDGFD